MWLWVAASTVGFVIVVKVVYTLRSGKCRSEVKLVGKTVIVTGASAGIGKETARDLAERGARVILACRNLEKAQKVADDIINTTGNGQVLVRELDTSDLKSVRKFAREILATEKRLDILHVSISGLLKSSSPSRVINVSSAAHYFCKELNFDINFEKKPYPGSLFVYSQSKLANNLFTLELSEKMKDTGVTTNCVHPGIVNTEIVLKENKNFLNYISAFIFWSMGKDEKLGAQTTIHLAVSEEVASVSGMYYTDCKITKPSDLASDKGLAKKLWEVSEDLVGLSQEEKNYCTLVFIPKLFTVFHVVLEICKEGRQIRERFIYSSEACLSYFHSMVSNISPSVIKNPVLEPIPNMDNCFNISMYYLSNPKPLKIMMFMHPLHMSASKPNTKNAARMNGRIARRADSAKGVPRHCDCTVSIYHTQINSWQGAATANTPDYEEYLTCHGINNAGMSGLTTKKITKDVLELTLATNHFGHFLLTNMLLQTVKHYIKISFMFPGLLRSSSPSRVINVSSAAHYFCKELNFDINFEKKPYLGSLFVYSQSKLANNLFTLDLSQKMKDTGVTTNCLHPGIVHTKLILKGNKNLLNCIIVFVFWSMSEKIAKMKGTSPKELRDPSQQNDYRPTRVDGEAHVSSHQTFYCGPRGRTGASWDSPCPSQNILI
ncbi:uncharacterized protein LOC134782500 [Penaeus indicus]|uniref:uncharacterized protein LOC134782500 n=1 Tax=Penaeus indicus TaxID=29960 RepID=UPI00300C866F